MIAISPSPSVEVAASGISTRRLRGFDDPCCTEDCWNRLLAQGDTNVVFLTKQWLQAWWETLGGGELLLIAAERGAEVVAIAPLYAIEGMVFFLGAGESDYVDFIGDVQDVEVLGALVSTAMSATPEFVGFRLHFISDRSRTGRALQAAAERLGLTCLEESAIQGVEMDLAKQPHIAFGSVNRSMRDRESYCRRNGELEVHSYRENNEIREQLAEFYAQHAARWQAKGIASPFCEPGQRAFLEKFLERAATTDWIRFLRINWNGRPLAFEFAWYYRGTHYSAPWCFAIDQAKHCPGHILLRRSVLAALASGLESYDLGIGDQPYKFRLPVRTHMCRTWGLYPE